MKYKVLILLLFFKVIIIEAQFAPFSEGQRYHAPDLFRKPEVSSLGIYGDTEVNIAEGKPNININLYTIKVDSENTFDISLNYDIAANKPDNVPSWTGLGWNLSSSGSITRSLRGEVDEVNGEGYYFNPGNYLGAGDWDSYGKMQTYIQKSKNVEKTASPDIFYFSVGKLHGKFFKNHQGNWIINCNEQDVIVSDVLKSNDLGMENFIYSFTITDSRGNVYTFGGTPESIERYRLRKKYILDPEYYNYVKNWHLTSIAYNSNKKINFTYNQAGRIYNKQIFGNYKRHSFKNWNGYTGCAYNIDQHDCFRLAAFEEGDISYLSKITFDSGEILFNRSIANNLEFKMGGATIDRNDIRPDNSYYNSKHRYKLESMIINYKNVNVDKIFFNYNDDSSKRLKLQAIAIGKDPSTAKKYGFEYNPNSFPDFHSNNIDHWGYFNNRAFNTYSIDMMNFGQVNDTYYQSREPNFQLNEILEKITYPTSGYSKFVYEPHTYSKAIDYNNGFSISNTSNNTTGGFRIKEIIDFDGTLEKKKQYFYVNDYFGGNNQSSGTVGRIQNYSSSSVIMQELSSSNIFNTTNNSHIVYSKVYEKLSNGGVTEYTFTNQDNGYIDSKASNFLTGCTFTRGFAGPNGNGGISWNSAVTEYYTPSSTFYKEYNSLENERAKILSKTEFDNTGKKLSKNTYEYSDDPQRFEKYGRFLSLEIGDYGIFSEIAPSGTPQADQRYLTSLAKVAAYRMYFYNHYLKSETSTIYSGNNESTTTKKYFYNGALHNQLTSEETTLPDNLTKKTTFQYATDLRHGNQPAQHFPPYRSIPYMIINNMLGIPLITSFYKDNVLQKRDQIFYEVTPENTSVILPKTKLSYSDDKTVMTPGYGYPSIPIPAPSPDYTDMEISYDKYDNKGNLLQYTLKDNIPVTLIWGYGQTQPIAKIEGITYSDLATKLNFQNTNSGYTTLPIVISSDSDTSANYEKQTFIPELDNFRKNPALKDYPVSTYSYDPLVGITSITPPSGIREYYIYDSANKLEKIVDINNKIVKEYTYNYSNKLASYLSAPRSQTFTRNTCSYLQNPGTYTYNLPQGAFVSYFSQAEADQMAQNELNVNGQNLANINATCEIKPFDCTVSTDFNVWNNSSNVFNKVINNNYSSYLVTIAFNTKNYNWGNFGTRVKIGRINGMCRPQFSKHIFAHPWSIDVDSNGDIYASLFSATTSYNPNSDLIIHFAVPFN
ncbi:DUF5977 domain-containing protein [Chryseobacterium arthrosphaerae]|uniref:DUF5977 domain-containing protein n=1 Tax=Chryseobacterium arthrosphaerae TaxID=651561 RepID=UPI001E516306|nr:DUF5977 domain-containing protein [Chryseobacterium arthrosphaerae]UEQ78877.1 hypothetical protein J8N07_11435 [Chryseobacterium arthrosphaerae]